MSELMKLRQGIDVVHEGHRQCIRVGLVCPISVKEQAERELVEATYEAAKYNQSKAAALYGVSRGTFRRLLKLFGEKYI